VRSDRPTRRVGSVVVERTRPRNQLGEPATTTPAETIARLKAKVFKNHGSANRRRIQAQISEEQQSPKV